MARADKKCGCGHTKHNEAGRFMFQVDIWVEWDEDFSLFSCSEAYLKLVPECSQTQFDSQSVCLDSCSDSVTSKVVHKNGSVHYMTRGLLLQAT